MKRINTKSNKQNLVENKLEEIRRDFVKMIPQLDAIQEAQESCRKVQEKEQYSYLNTYTSSGMAPRFS